MSARRLALLLLALAACAASCVASCVARVSRVPSRAPQVDAGAEPRDGSSAVAPDAAEASAPAGAREVREPP
ncbi:MAG: hypothetical protein JWP97_6733, partial [Labilithrix sp.]|nr:hypothetical protein [Labilithrix sp.]